MIEYGGVSTQDGWWLFEIPDECGEDLDDCECEQED